MGTSVAASVIAVCDVIILIIAASVFIWAVSIAAGVWPSYWWLTVLAGVVCLIAVLGVGAAVFLALPEDRVGVNVSTMRRISFAVLFPAIGSLVASVATLFIVGVTVPSFF